MSKPVFFAQTPCKDLPEDVTGEYIVRDGESWYKISNYDAMQPFFISVVSASNFWLFASTTGGLTCGRTNSDLALFPYYTVDKIHDSSPHTGPKTAVIVEKDGRSFLWEPFVFHPAVYKTTRNLYKNMLGNMLTYEEINEDLGLSFSYTWASADEYGIVRKCRLLNHSADSLNVRVLDGLQNIMAANTNGWLQDHMSNLLEAYKWSELADEQVGVFCLYAKQSDRAEPLESLKATTVWHRGLPSPQILLSSAQLPAFLEGRAVEPEPLVRGKRASFLVHSSFGLVAGAEQTWIMVAEVEQYHDTITKLQGLLANKEEAIIPLVDADIKQGSQALKNIIGSADGFQCTEDQATCTHHYANVMFNTMRGGIYDKGYIIDRADLTAFLTKRNVAVKKRHEAWLAGLSEAVDYLELLKTVQTKGDVDLIRLAFEYIPVTFSRRHGDPSRPWNRFAIQLKDEDGNRILSYQGNWRDIFQNWEALTFGFPFYYESIIAKFVNASTVDGYNPYVVTKDGINWECPEPDHPHAHIGYWGDHQIIYLLKLLEWCSRFQPGLLEANCDKDRFSYANVPYEIRPYPKIVENAKDTIQFNWNKHKQIESLQKTMGADAKLLLDGSGSVVHVNLAEKLLVPLLAKASNFVVGGGIWLNTQRPEWNDANNAIVGFGLSMVTVSYMRRYTQFLLQLFRSLPASAVHVSEEVAQWLHSTAGVLAAHAPRLGGAALTGRDRRTILDGLGEAASAYRWQIYEKGLSGAKEAVKMEAITKFLETLEKFIDYTMGENKTEGGLYQAYNILVLGPDTADISHLYDMLEGQVAALSSGLVTADAAAAMFKHLYSSEMYREDQHTFMLYPDRQLRPFMQRNVIPAARADDAAVQFCLTHRLRSLLYRDARGQLHFGPNLCNGNELKEAVEACKQPGLKDHLPALLEIYEETFNHRAFTGRSGTMFAFEGLGCIYWHMVSKLLLAAQELSLDALDKQDPSFEALCKYYYEVRAGIGFNKNPKVYGAFPSDPYSHTPKQAGAQQPGMTGQVKEEVLTRFGELGIRICNGSIRIQPKLLRVSEFLQSPKHFEYATLRGDIESMTLHAGQLGFTYCQCPFIYTKGPAHKILVHCRDGAVNVDGDTLPQELAAEIFRRSGKVKQVNVEVDEADLLAF